MADAREACLQVEEKVQKRLEEQVEELSSLQRLHYASNRYAVLLIFQAMDAAGKDDDKENARLIIAEIILDAFNGLKMAYPKPSAKRRRELQLIRKRLVK